MKNIVDLSVLVTDLGAQRYPTVIFVVGTGGKASLLFWLVELLRVSDRRVLVTTTTRTFMPTPHWPVVFRRDPAILPHAPLTSPISFCFHSWKANQGRVQEFTSKTIDALVRRPECDIILIKADGSREMPLETPDGHEPCIPESSYYVITVMGGHILGAKVSTENVHRWSQFTNITGLTPDTTLQLNDLVVLVRYPQGAFKNVSQGYRRVWSISCFSQCENAIA